MIDSELMPGDIGFAVIPGSLGRWVALGQALLGDECWLTHTFLVVRDGPPGTPLEAVEAMPSGARRVSMTGRYGGNYAYVRLPMSNLQRDALSAYALDLVRGGVRYSFADYLALALWKWRIPGRRLIRKYVERSDRMICSQLADYVLTAVGFHAFADGRLPQEVTPGQLFRQLGALGAARWWPVSSMGGE